MRTRASRLLGRALDVVLGALLLAVVGLAFAQMSMRYLLASGFLWVEELSVILMVWFVALGAARLWLLDGHVAVPLLPDGLGPGARRALLVGFDLLAIGAGALLLVASRPLLEVYGTIALDTLPLTAWIKYAPLPAAGLALAAAGALRLAERLWGG